MEDKYKYIKLSDGRYKKVAIEANNLSSEDLNSIISNENLGEDIVWKKLSDGRYVNYNNYINELSESVRTNLSNGTSGTSGLSGTSGTSGLSGTSGVNGQPGRIGLIGPRGKEGLSGTSGTSGLSGTSGIDGERGATGSAGKRGEKGERGERGFPGIGIKGEKGDPGTGGSGRSSTGYRFVTEPGTISEGSQQVAYDMFVTDTLIVEGGNQTYSFGSQSFLDDGLLQVEETIWVDGVFQVDGIFLSGTGLEASTQSSIVIQPTRYIGEDYGGGIIASLWYEGTTQRGLILAKDLFGPTAFSNIISATSGASSSTNGVLNTQIIINQSGHISSAAKICDNYTYGTYSDWYLPSIEELNIIVESRPLLNVIYGASYSLSNSLTTVIYYWSSTESTSLRSGDINLSSKSTSTGLKSNLEYVRPVRKL